MPPGRCIGLQDLEKVLRACAAPKEHAQLPDTSEIEFTFLLDAYQFGSSELSEKFDSVARPLLRGWAKQNGWGLPAYALEDVVQEVFASLANPATVRFDPVRGTVEEYLLGRLLNAVKTMQSLHGLRRTGTDFEQDSQREFVPLDDLDLRSPHGVLLSAINAREVAAKIFNGVDSNVKDACMRVWADGESQAAVAAELGMSRFALARKLARVKAGSMQYALCS